MTTYRHRLVWLVDGEYTTRNRGKSQSVNRTLDRRIKRREHHSITREAVDSWYADAHDAYYEYIRDYDNSFMEPEWDEYEIEDYEIEYDPSDYILNDWGYDDYYDEPDHWGSREVSPEDKRFIEREDVGKSLGEILQEIQQNQRR